MPKEMAPIQGAFPAVYPLPYRMMIPPVFQMAMVLLKAAAMRSLAGR